MYVTSCNTHNSFKITYTFFFLLILKPSLELVYYANTLISCHEVPIGHPVIHNGQVFGQESNILKYHRKT